MALGGDSFDANSSAAHALDQFTTGVDHLVKALENGALDELDTPGFVVFMRGLERARNRIPLADHRVIADAERRDLPEALTQGTMVRTWSSTLLISAAEASRRVRAAAAVGDRTSMTGEPLGPVRPVLAAAQRAGEVNPEQVTIIERALSKVDVRGFDPAAIDAGEELLTEFATRFGPKDLSVLAQDVIDHIDTDGTRPQDDLNADRRHFYLRQTRDGAWTGEFRLTGALGSKLQALLAPLAKQRIDTSVTGSPVDGVDVRTKGQRWHDALEDVCDRVLRSDPTLPDAGGTPTTLILTLDMEDLLARTGYAVASDGTLIPTKTAIVLADQADIYFAAVTAAGVPLWLGRARRIATLGQTAALIARDKGCSFPGCATPPEYCERHHIQSWVDGGATDLDNLTLLCRYHHLHFAIRGWTCRLNADRLPEWRAPYPLDPQQKPMINGRISGALAAHRYRTMRT